MKKPLLLAILSFLSVLNIFAADPDWQSLTWRSIGKGRYVDTFVSNIYRWNKVDEVSVEVEECVEHPGIYRVIKPWAAYGRKCDGNLIIDARDPDLVVIPEQRTGYMDSEDGELMLKSCSSYFIDDMQLDLTTFCYQYDYCISSMVDDVIYFPAGNIAYRFPDSDPDYGLDKWMRSNRIWRGYLALEGAEPGQQPEYWQSIGTGKFFDGMVETYLNYSYEPEYREVEVEEFKSIPGIYRLHRPWGHIWPVCGDLLIDVSDPEYGRVPLINTGLTSDMGVLWIVSYTYNYDKETMMSSLPEKVISFDAAKGLVTFPKASIVFNFPDSDYPTSFYDNNLSEESYFYLPGFSGIDRVSADGSADAPVEYYNLQGIRVSEPAKGQLLIRRQGDKVTKEVIK